MYSVFAFIVCCWVFNTRYSQGFNFAHNQDKMNKKEIKVW